ncbi:MAG TPA: relaxase domain-containing protein [Stellaceae bacterium]|nr:relaxase domain-containing protein [Stellaceae bacterium]
MSLAWAFAPTEAERNAIAPAHRDAVHKTMLLVAETIGQARRGQGGRNGAEPGAIGWISFDHYAARPPLEIARSNPDGTVETELVTVKVAGDPQLHTHVAVPNAVLTPSAHVGSLDTLRMHHKIHEWGAIYQACHGLARRRRRHPRALAWLAPGARARRGRACRRPPRQRGRDDRIHRPRRIRPHRRLGEERQ